MTLRYATRSKVYEKKSKERTERKAYMIHPVKKEKLNALIWLLARVPWCKKF